jgi:aminoglycoside 6'-N-acetyltransferase
VLQGSLVLLRPARPDDVDALMATFATPEVEAWWPRYDRDRIEDEVLHPGDPDSMILVIEVAGDPVGVIHAHEETDPEYHSASIDIAVDPRWHGRGVARDAIRTLAAHLMDDRGQHRLTIDPAAANTRAFAAYTTVGFRPVGVLRQNELAPDGSWRDGLLMDLVRGELR